MLKQLKKSIKCLAFTTWDKTLSNDNQEYIFIMAHPRSGSSLLMHLLDNHKEIIGFGEYYIKYKDKKSLRLFEFDVRRKTGNLFKGKKYIANQIVDNSLTQDFEILNSKKIKHIFLIREPKKSLSSLMTLSEKRLGHNNENEALNIYSNRLLYLMNLTSKIPSESRCFLTYEELIENTDNTLTKLSQFLELKDPLTSYYKTKKFTQIWGDPSDNIKKGMVFKTDSRQITISKEVLLQAESIYIKTMNNFKGD